MQKVITINLNGNAYQIEEAGYGALVGYLDGAQRQLRDNPDRAEIIADLEQAIADKCARFLSAQKSVVTSSEVDQIIREMGPVEAAAGGAGDGGEPKAGPKAPKRLYLIREGAVLAGVCNGIAAYIGIDPTIVRILFVLIAIGTKGAFIFVYIVLAIVIPSADTSEERAAAFGEMFNARELIDRAAKNLKDGGRDWNRSWRRQNRRWRRQWRKSAHSAAWAAAPPPPPPPPSPPAGYATRMLAGFMVPILSIVSAAFFWICAYAVLSLATMREAFGLLLPDDVPLWVGIVLLLFLYQSVAWPLHAARRASYQALGGPHHASVAALDGMLSLGIALLVVWFAYNNVPAVREFLRALPETFDSMQR